MRHIDEIVLHCSATTPGWWAGRSAAEKRDEIRRWHVEDRGWSDIGYHYVIDRDGTVVPGRSVARKGAHCIEANEGSIGVCLLGARGAAASDEFDDHFTPRQRSAVYNLIDNLKAAHPIRRITGHNSYANKGCPGFQVKQFLAERRAEEAERRAAQAEGRSAPARPARRPQPNPITTAFAAIGRWLSGAR